VGIEKYFQLEKIKEEFSTRLATFFRLELEFRN